eukprot:SAG22_NODE_1970_length_3231_cov_4.101533_6_plen_227_part_00
MFVRETEREREGKRELQLDTHVAAPLQAVLGGHVFDLARIFAGGDPEWVQARVLHQGRAASRADVRESPGDRVGPLVGDEINATFGFADGTLLTYTSREAQREVRAVGWGMELAGTAGALRVSCKALSFCCAPTVFLSKTVSFHAVCLARCSSRSRRRSGSAAGRPRPTSGTRSRLTRCCRVTRWTARTIGALPDLPGDTNKQTNRKTDKQTRTMRRVGSQQAAGS